MSRPVVIVMVKAPRAGFVKTRLSPPLSPADAAAIAGRFVQDVVNNARRAVRELIVAYAPTDGREPLQALLPRGLLWMEQEGENLGARLEAAIAHAFERGFGPVIVLGADSPTLPESFIADACAALIGEETDAAMGPTADGGYYLLGLRAPARGLLRDVRWSTPDAFQDTAANARRAGLRLLQLPAWRDVDTFDDLLSLRDELFSTEAARLRAPATHRWLLTHSLPPSSST
ncbi:MAG TPA: TIGR04282 family arsenosugar biosynthesis glycosyltransferase [Pyrinomonadaceae bacterium]